MDDFRGWFDNWKLMSPDEVNRAAYLVCAQLKERNELRKRDVESKKNNITPPKLINHSNSYG